MCYPIETLRKRSQTNEVPIGKKKDMQSLKKG